MCVNACLYFFSGFPFSLSIFRDRSVYVNCEHESISINYFAFAYDLQIGAVKNDIVKLFDSIEKYGECSLCLQFD